SLAGPISGLLFFNLYIVSKPLLLVQAFFQGLSVFNNRQCGVFKEVVA
mgnify:CR=1